MSVLVLAEAYAKGFMHGRRDGDSKKKAIAAALIYVKPRTEDEDRYLRAHLERVLA
jgi:hypothetical protein